MQRYTVIDEKYRQGYGSFDTVSVAIEEADRLATPERPFLVIKDEDKQIYRTGHKEG